MRLGAQIAAVFGVAFICISAQADSLYSVNITELAAADIYASVVLPNFTFTGDITGVESSSGEIFWNILDTQNYSPGVIIKRSNPDGSQIIESQLAWLEPEGTYDWFAMGYDGNTGTEALFASSDRTAVSLGNGNPYGIGASFYNGCFYGFVAGECPIANDGQTITVPLSDTSGTFLGDMDVTFNDEGDIASAAPEPGTFSLFGLALLGLAATFSRKPVYSPAS